MRMFCEKDYEAMSRRAAQVIAAEITHNPACVLGLATGSTPEGAYRYLVDWYQQGLISFQDVLSVNLDEYKGLEPSHDQSYRYFMQSNLFDHVDIVPENTRPVRRLYPLPGLRLSSAAGHWPQRPHRL